MATLRVRPFSLLFCRLSGSVPNKVALNDKFIIHPVCLVERGLFPFSSFQAEKPASTHPWPAFDFMEALSVPRSAASSAIYNLLPRG